MFTSFKMRSNLLRGATYQNTCLRIIEAFIPSQISMGMASRCMANDSGIEHHELNTNLERVLAKSACLENLGILFLTSPRTASRDVVKQFRQLEVILTSK